MKPVDAARTFILGGRSVHMCGGSCDCIGELAKLIERQCELAVRRHERLKLAKPRIAEALEDTRSALRKRA